MCDNPLKKRKTMETAEATLRELEDPTNMGLLQNKNPHELDKRIRFKEEGHIYWIDGVSENTMSSTTLIKKFFPSFDKDRATRYIFASKRHQNDETYKYYKMSKDEIIKSWADKGTKSAAIGTYNHLQLELYYNGLDYDRTIPEINMFMDFVDSLDPNWEPYRTEMLIFHPILRVTGSVDMIYRDKSDGKLIMVDWKFCKSIGKSKSNGVGIGKLSHLNNDKYYHYALQLNLYKRILEEIYGFEVKKMLIVCLHRSQSKFKKIEVIKLDNEISYILNERKKELVYKNIGDVKDYNVFINN